MKFVAVEVGKKEWPKGQTCVVCSKTFRPGDVVAVGRSVSYGTLGFHKECLVDMVSQKFPETQYEKIRAHIVATNGDPWGIYEDEPIDV